MWKSILDFFQRLIVSFFSGFASKITKNSKRNKTGISVEDNRKCDIKNINLKSGNQDCNINISNNQNGTIEDITIK